jgi:hypothetical protein
MKNVLGITNDLSQALQQKDQDILNTMKLVEISKLRLQVMREDGWNSLLGEVSKFCTKNNIAVLNMNEFYQPQSRQKTQGMKNLHHYPSNYQNLCSPQYMRKTSKLLFLIWTPIRHA